MRNMPTPFTRDQLVEVLTDMLERVKVGDSFEGSLEYLMPGPGDPEDAEFLVRAAWRVGNLRGQGGMNMVGEMREVPDGPAD